MTDASDGGGLKREVGLAGAVMMGLGSMVGAGVFVSIGVAAGVIGPAVVLAIALAGLVATCNALSSAQLAASRPVSGGTYEYGYAYLNSWLGFSAGWMFLSAKSASAATAALGFAGYLLRALGIEGFVVPLACATAAVMTLVVLGGIRTSNRANMGIVTVTVLSLVFFALAGLFSLTPRWQAHWIPFFKPGEDGIVASFLEATALMFVAFTGYARIATLGEEVVDPRHTIPRAIIATLVLSGLLYVLAAAVSIATIGAERMAGAGLSEVAPLQVAAATFNVPGAAAVITAGALTAMLSVLLNLILGLSRMLLAMGRRADMPRLFAAINQGGTPHAAVIAVGIIIAALALLGDVKLTWSFSAFTVLIYYAITNLAALRLPAEKRFYSPLFAWGGLVSCLCLAFWVEWQVWLFGLGLIATGLIWHALAQQFADQA